MPTEIDISDPFQPVLAGLLPLLLLFGYIPPIYNTVFRLVKEKESGAKESMRMMGMTDAPYWISWWLHFTMINTLVSLAAWGVLLINVNHYSDKIYLLAFFWLYGEAIFGQILFLQSFFSASKYAGIVSTIVYFGASLVNQALDSATLSRGLKVTLSLIPQAAIHQGAVVYANYECTGVGLNPSTASVVYDGYSFDTALYMMAASAVLFTVLGLYLDKVIPSTYGKRRSPCFCLAPQYYGCCRRERRARVAGDEAERLMETGGEDEDFEAQFMPENNYEPPPVIARRLEANGDYLKIEGLRREFGDFVAVNSLNVKMYDS